MTHLLSDPRVVEAAARRIERFGWPYKQNSRAAAKQMLTAAVAALPREELIETFAKAAFADRWPGKSWDRVAVPLREKWRGNTEAGMEAIGLIPESMKEPRP